MTKNNPGPAISERARQLADEQGITFHQALRELARRARCKRGMNKARQRAESQRREASVESLERRGLF